MMNHAQLSKLSLAKLQKSSLSAQMTAISHLKKVLRKLQVNPASGGP